MQKVQNNFSEVKYVEPHNESLKSNQSGYDKTLYVTRQQRNGILGISFGFVLVFILGVLCYTFISPKTETVNKESSKLTSALTPQFPFKTHTISPSTQHEIALHEISIYETIERIGPKNLSTLEHWRYKNFSTNPFEAELLRSTAGDKLFYNILYIKKVDNEIRLLRLNDLVSHQISLLTQTSLSLKASNTPKEESKLYRDLEKSFDDNILEITRIKETIYYQQAMLDSKSIKLPVPALPPFPFPPPEYNKMPHPILPAPRVSLDEVEGRLPNIYLNDKNNNQKTIPASDLLLSE